MKSFFTFFLFFLINLGFAQTSNIEDIVQTQVEAYNNKDIEAFLKTYSEDVKIFSFPKKLMYSGKKTMRKVYSALFSEVSVLNCVIKNRIIIGNKVIDEEYVQFDNEFSNAVAIYEVKNGKIDSVTFIVK